MSVGEFIGWLDGLVWGTVMMVLIIVVGILLSVRTKFHPQRRLGLSLKYAVNNEDGAEGDVSSFGALTTALAATVGTGNIVGVSTAIMGGGPGALFWMEFAAFFGIATKYAEGVLAVKYRHVKEDGSILGGPFYYIEKGMGPKWKWLGKLFALFGALAGALGIGTSTQVNGIVNAINKVAVEAGATKVAFTAFGEDATWVKVIAAIIITAGTIAVIVGGIQRIAQVTEKIVPAMMVLYVVSALLVFFFNIGHLGEALVKVFSGATRRRSRRCIQTCDPEGCCERYLLERGRSRFRSYRCCCCTDKRMCTSGHGILDRYIPRHDRNLHNDRSLRSYDRRKRAGSRGRRSNNVGIRTWIPMAIHASHSSHSRLSSVGTTTLRDASTTSQTATRVLSELTDGCM